LVLRPPARYPNRAGSRCASVVAAAPAGTVTVPPTFALLPNAGWLSSHVRPHRREVSTLSGRVRSPHGSTPIQPITGRPSLAPSSSTHCPIRLPCGFPSGGFAAPKGNGLTTFRRENQGWFRSRLFAGGTTSASEEFGASDPDHVPFGPSLILKPPRGGHDLGRSSAAPLACPL
jgi:hypothetical protein